MTRRSILALLTALPVGILTAWLHHMRNPYYSGPVSDHFDGTRFFDPSGATPKGLGELLKWSFGSDPKAIWPQSLPPVEAHPPLRVEGADICVTMLGHASMLLQTEGLNILTDPVLSQRASPFAFAGPKRVQPPALNLDSLPPIDLIVVTHNHYDHLDGKALKGLHERFRPRIITPLGNDKIMRAFEPSLRIETLDWGDNLALKQGVTLHALPSRHWSARGLFDRNKALWAAFVFETPNGNIYHIGDTGYGDGAHFKAAKARFGGFRLALIPIGAYEPRWFMADQHVNPQEAVQIMLDCGAKQAIGHHFGTFQLTNEAIDAPIQALQQALAAHNIATERFVALGCGQSQVVNTL